MFDPGSHISSISECLSNGSGNLSFNITLILNEFLVNCCWGVASLLCSAAGAALLGKTCVDCCILCRLQHMFTSESLNYEDCAFSIRVKCAWNSSWCSRKKCLHGTSPTLLRLVACRHLRNCLSEINLCHSIRFHLLDATEFLQLRLHVWFNLFRSANLNVDIFAGKTCCLPQESQAQV